jgi:hypothetical protein
MHRFRRWREALDAAHTQAAVEKVMLDYAATLKPVLPVLPDECRKAVEVEDLQSAAVTLLHCELAYRGSSEVADLLHEIAHTYAAASLRLSRIKAEPLAGKADD